MSAPSTNHRLIEAILFASSAPVTEADLAQRLAEGVDVPAILADIAADYATRGVNLVTIGGGWAFRTAPDLASRLRLTAEVPRKLSRAAVEALAIIAYHQPVTRGEIEQIRGVALSRGTIDVLLEAGWIGPKGRRHTKPGRPLTWGTTPSFLDHFGLGDLRDLPGLDELKAAGLLDSRPGVMTIAMREEEGGAPLPGEEEDPEPDLLFDPDMLLDDDVPEDEHLPFEDQP